MIFYGYRKDSLFVADLPMQACTLCGTPGMLQLFVNYTSVHLYWIFGVVTNRKYLATCSSCGGAKVESKHDVIHLIVNDPIPFMERWGIAILLAAIGLGIAYGVFHPSS